MRRLEKLTIKNFKSIREQTLELGALNVFIGANGAGKSNLIEVFRLLREIWDQNLANYIAVKGGADRFLYFGRKKSPAMDFSLYFVEREVSNPSSVYRLNLTGTLDDRLIIGFEVFNAFPDEATDGEVGLISRSSTESELKNTPNARKVLYDLDSFRIYHFHDTTDAAPVKSPCDVDDNRFLRPQAENLPAFLYWLQEKQPGHFANIEDTLRQIAPFFGKFRLAPSKLNEKRIKLEWVERGSDAYFDAASFSDGTLRFLCLATLLLQPDLPAIVLLDEPELGLHPAAITILAGMLESAATKTQVIVATQSVTLVNQLGPESVWTVDREDNQSVFRHLSNADLGAWLEGYSLGELWEKNVFGARP